MRASRSGSGDAPAPAGSTGSVSGIEKGRRNRPQRERLSAKNSCDTRLCMPLVECVPNVSEGRRPEIVDWIVDAIRRASGTHVLDVSADASHNRSVITMAGSPRSLEDAVPALYAEAI